MFEPLRMRESKHHFFIAHKLFIEFMRRCNMAENIIIYGKAGWPYTEKARSVYGAAEYFDVKQDHRKLEEMLLHSKGVRKVPVIVEGEKVSIGYEGSWGI